MTNLKRLYLDDRVVTMVYEDDPFEKITEGMNLAAEAMLSYAELDMKATMFMFKRLQKRLYPKVKHTSDLRTNSARKWAGHKNNKPKYYWSKKRKRRGGWKV